MPEHLEADGGNLYRPHPLMVHSGQFWRCAHGSTGFMEDMKWVGCEACGRADMDAYAKFHGTHVDDLKTRRIQQLEAALERISQVEGADDCGGTVWQCAEIAKAVLNRVDK